MSFPETLATIERKSCLSPMIFVPCHDFLFAFAVFSPPKLSTSLLESWHIFTEPPNNFCTRPVSKNLEKHYKTLESQDRLLLAILSAAMSPLSPRRYPNFASMQVWAEAFRFLILIVSPKTCIKRHHILHVRQTLTFNLYRPPLLQYIHYNLYTSP